MLKWSLPLKRIAMLFTLLLLSRLEGVGAAAETDFRVVSGVALDEAIFDKLLKRGKNSL